MASRKACKRKTDDDDETWSPSAKRGRGKKSTAGAAAAAGCGGGIGLWIIWCTRKAQVIEMDEDSYIEADSLESVDHFIDKEVEAGNGRWCYNTGSAPQHVAQSARAGERAVDVSGQGSLVVFSSLERANEQAAKVWRDMQRYYPASWRRIRQETAPEPAGAGEQCCTVLPDGRKRWRRERRFYADPCGSHLKNEAACVETVEVLPAVAG